MHNYGFERSEYDWDPKSIDTSFRINVKINVPHITPVSVRDGWWGRGMIYLSGKRKKKDPPFCLRERFIGPNIRKSSLHDKQGTLEGTRN